MIGDRARAHARFTILRRQGLTAEEIAAETHYSAAHVRAVLADPRDERRRGRLTPLQRAVSPLNELASEAA